MKSITGISLGFDKWFHLVKFLLVGEEGDLKTKGWSKGEVNFSTGEMNLISVC